MASAADLPPSHTSREAIARRDLGRTTISPATARVLAAAFVTLMMAGFAIDATTLFKEREQLAAAGPWQRRGVSLERALERSSVISATLRPPAQWALTRWLRAGNERVYVGREGWLFYRQDVEYVTGRGFLDARQLDRRRSTAPASGPIEPDPRPAILALHRQLAARGIALIVMPAPVKPSLYPEHLGGGEGVDPARTVQNPSYAGFVEELRRNGVVVFDPATAIAPLRAEGPQYLLTDTHWRPETMEAVAEGLAAVISTAAALPEAPDPGFVVERVEVRNTGDIARMLDLPAAAAATLYPPESVWLRRVLRADGSPWRSSRDADVLLLGDSFSNIYSLESMGWGTSAGLAEQLSYALRRPVDRITQNDEGAFATRQLLQRDPDRLTGKRVVVYEFAARELALGDWKR